MTSLTAVEVDPAGHNVAASVVVTWRISAANTGPGAPAAGWTLSLLLAKNSIPVVPPSNAMHSCATAMSPSGFPLIRRTGKGPLGPGVASFATDVSMRVPTGAAGASGGSVLPVVAYVTRRAVNLPR